MKFSELIAGDRFYAYGSLWTKLDTDTARKHSAHSIALGDKGHAYHGDSICSFGVERDDEVEFVPPIEMKGGEDAA